MSKKSRLASYAAKGNVPGSAPANTVLPSISGAAQEGMTLTATQGTWTGSPTSFAYQWRRCNGAGASCSDIGSATSSTYVLQGADVASTIRVVVTATNAIGSTAATSGQTSGIAAAPPSTLSTNIVAILGDSRPHEVDGGLRATAGYLHHFGFMNWARRYSHGAIQFNRALDFAVGGYTTTDVVNNKLTACKNSTASCVVVMCGVNDALGPGGDASRKVTQATSLANLDTIKNQLVAAGKTVFFCDESPAIEPAGAPTTQHLAIRDRIRGYAGSSNVYIIPSWNAAAESPDSTTPGPGFEDTVHYGALAASNVGQAVSTTMLPRLPAFNLAARSGVLSGGDFTGTAGTKTGGVTGTVPTGWTVNLESGSGTVACAMNVTGGYNWLVVTLTNGTAPRIGIYSGNLSSGWTAGTDRLDMAVKCQIDAGSSNIIGCQLYSLQTVGNPSSILLHSGGNPAEDGAIIGNSTMTLPTYAMDFTMWMPHVLYPVGATSFIQRMEINGAASGTSHGVFRFANPQLRKYAGTLTD